MQWEDGPNAGFSTGTPAELYAPLIQGEPYGPDLVNVAAQQSDPDSLWHTVKRMIALRKAYPLFGWGSFTWIDSKNDAVASYWRNTRKSAC
jgi:maltose alpha-D-glucosyltransferase/alpha-amylase